MRNEVYLFRHILSGKYGWISTILRDFIHTRPRGFRVPRRATACTNTRESTPLKWRVRSIAKIFYRDECKQRVTADRCWWVAWIFYYARRRRNVQYRPDANSIVTAGNFQRRRTRETAAVYMDSVISALRVFFFFARGPCINSEKATELSGDRRRDEYDTPTAGALEIEHAPI